MPDSAMKYWTKIEKVKLQKANPQSQMIEEKPKKEDAPKKKTVRDQFGIK
jgi:hypothetical protein